MGNHTINLTWSVEGVLTDPTSAVLCDPTGTYGVKRTDTGVKIIDINTPMVKSSTGVYSYSNALLPLTLPFTAYIKVVHNGATYYFEQSLPITLSGDDDTPLVSYAYTSKSEIERVYSVEATLARTEDVTDEGAVSGVFADVIAEVTDEINLYCDKWYEDVQLVQSPWIRRQATWMACHYLSMRRGDPGQYHDRYERIISLLEKVLNGTMQIPRLATKSDLTPALSNYRVDDRFHIAKTRVQPTISSGGTSGRQQLDPQFPCEWYR